MSRNPYVESFEKDIKNRALVAYLKTDKNQPGTIEIATIDGFYYVVLSNVNGILAVYRYVSQRDVLKRLRRYPKQLA